MTEHTQPEPREMIIGVMDYYFTRFVGAGMVMAGITEEEMNEEINSKPMRDIVLRNAREATEEILALVSPLEKEEQ